MNRLCCLLVLSAALASFSAAAQYPGKPVRIVVPFSAGGTTDILARAVGQKLTAAWSQRVDITHVPYKGGAPAVTDLVGGQISMFFAGMPIVMPHVKAGRLRALAVTVTRRSPAAPEVPTMEEAGVPGFDISNWFGVYVPAATPKAVIAKLNSEMSRVLNLADVKERLAEQGLETVGNSVEQFDVFFRAEILKYAKIIRESGARPD